MCKKHAQLDLNFKMGEQMAPNSWKKEKTIISLADRIKSLKVFSPFLWVVNILLRLLQIPGKTKKYNFRKLIFIQL
jgi:hypothetical protein